MKNKLLIIALCSFSVNVFAEETVASEIMAAIDPEVVEEPTEPLTLSTELGALLQTGDTESSAIKFAFDIDYDKDLWRGAIRFDLLARKSDVEDDNGEMHSETTDQKWKLVGQTNYTINEERNNYIYGNASYDDNRFGGFESQSSISAGWGRRWFESKGGSLDADIGPGYKKDVARYEDDNGNEYTEDQGAFIIQAQALYIRNINEHVEFRQLVVAKYATESGENSNYQAETSLTTKLISTLQLKVSFKVDHNTEVEDDQENTNTETGITLVYSF
jgi:putative salt-induced outer membrane protein YdiY